MVVEKLLSLNIPFAVVISTPFGIENSPLGKDVFVIFHELNKKEFLKEIEFDGERLTKSFTYKDVYEYELLRSNEDFDEIDEFENLIENFIKVPNTESGRVYEPINNSFFDYYKQW